MIINRIGQVWNCVHGDEVFLITKSRNYLSPGQTEHEIFWLCINGKNENFKDTLIEYHNDAAAFEKSVFWERLL